jgi:insulysin
MGTEKYPNEAEWADFVSKSGGYNNAYTDYMNTNYHFDCSNEALSEVLDRFAQFFIAPLFGESQTEREINAVDSEFNMS